MKKTIMIALLVMMLVFTTACGDSGSGGGDAVNDGPTPFARLEAANSAYEEADSFIADFLIDMDMSLDGESFMTYIMSGEMAIDAEDESDVRFSMKTTNDIKMMGQGEAMEMDAYYLDGYYYITTMGMDLKVEMPLEEAMEQTEVAEGMMFDEADIISQSADGNTLTFTVKGDSMTEIFDESMGEMMAQFGSDASVEYGDVTYTVYLSENDELKRMDASCSIIMNIMGETATADMTISLDIKQIGNVTIDYPDNLDEFMEVDADLLGL